MVAAFHRWDPARRIGLPGPAGQCHGLSGRRLSPKLVADITLRATQISAFSFFRPASGRDWRSFGAFSAFLVALFAEMNGFPLTICLLSGWLQSRYPGVDWFAHDSGHLPEMLFGWRANPHFGTFHLASMLVIGGGFVLLARAWPEPGPSLYRAQRAGVLAERGPYGRVRHPQYVAFVLIMFGFLLQWPTVLTVLMCRASFCG